MFRITRKVFPLGIRIWQQRMARERFDGKRVRRVKIEILFEAIGVKEIIANPSSWQRRKLPRIKIKLEPLTGSKNDKAIIGSTQQIEDISVARVISRRVCIRTGHASLRIRINGIARRLQPDFARIANEDQSQWFLRVPFTEVELDPMQLGESSERQPIETRDVFAVAPRDQR